MFCELNSKNEFINKSKTYIMPTQEQLAKIDTLKQQGYVWDKQLSISYAAVVMTKDSDLYVFGLDGSILHNPETIKYITN